MAERVNPADGSTRGAIDVMYFPPARSSSTTVAHQRCHEPVQPAVALKKECDLAYVFVTACKRWSCDRRIFCDDAPLDDILRYTSPYPEDFIGVGSYNPLQIATSTHELEIGTKTHGFRGVYVHPGSFGLSLSDRRMYPLYLKALEWHVPVILDLRPLPDGSQSASHAEMERVAGDFPELKIVGALPEWSLEEMLHLVENLANIHFCFDTSALHITSVRSFVGSAAGESRCMWGSNGLPWKEALAEVSRLNLSNSSKLLRENALRLFGLEHLPCRRATPFIESEDASARIFAE